jgi:hypothetical protein
MLAENKGFQSDVTFSGNRLHASLLNQKVTATTVTTGAEGVGDVARLGRFFQPLRAVFKVMKPNE